MAVPAKNTEWAGLDLSWLFKRYYAHVLKFKNMLAEGRIDLQQFDDVDVSVSNGEEEARFISTYLRNKLQEQLDYVSLHARQSELQIYKQAQYVMATLTDEVFLLGITGWRGQPFWSDWLLERRIFGTSNAGEEIIKRISALMETETLSQPEKQLAQVYLLSMQLGFAGIRDQLDRQQLLRKVSATEHREHLFPSAYYGVIRRAKAERMSPMSRWHRFTIQLAVLFLLVSTAAWIFVTKPLWSLH